MTSQAVKEARARELSYLSGGGDMGERIRGFDWGGTSIGELDRWPQSLRSALSICLNSSFPTAIYWGLDLRLLYNDAWAPIPAERHPWALGRPASEVWSDIWDVVGPQLQAVLREGRGFSVFDQLLPMIRNGRPQETYWNYSFTPIRGEDGRVAGVFNQGNEVTERVLGDRRQRFLFDLTDRLRHLADPLAIIAEAQNALGRHLRANRVGYGKTDETGRWFTTEGNWTDGTVPPRHGTQDLANFGPEIYAALRSGTPLVMHDVSQDPRIRSPDVRAALAGIETQAAITATLVKENRIRAALYVHRREPFHWSAGDVELVQDVAERTWAAVERARAEQELKRSEARLRVLNETLAQQVAERTADRDRMWRLSTELMLVARFDGTVVATNPAWETVLGWREGELAGRSFFDLVHPDDLAATTAEAGQLEDGVSTMRFENRYRTRDGSYRWLSWTAVPDAGRIHAVARDVTGERQIARDRERIWTLSPVLKVVTDKHGMITDISPAWTKSLGWSRDETIGRRSTDFMIADEEAWRTRVQTLASGASLLEYETVLLAKSGEQRVVKWTTVPEADAFYGFGRDITAEREAASALAETEEKLRQAQKMEAVGQLTGGIAHDFNNLLTGVIGSLDLMRKRIEQGRIGDLPRCMEVAQTSAERAASLTHRLLAFARRQPLDPKPADVNALVVGMEDLLRRTIGAAIALETDLADGLWPALCDTHQFENAILNLTINARDAMPDGGRVMIATAKGELDAAYARSQADVLPGDYVVVSVSDTGAGMAPGVLAKVFEPFFTTKPIGQGTGLGLPMVYGFVKQLGGHIRIHSMVGQGTSVRLYLPRHKGAVEREAEKPAVELPRAQAGESVLVVEDEEAVRVLVTDVLKELGYKALEASEGKSALPILNSTARIDLLVTDVGLPGSLNGRQVAEIARQRRPDLKVLFITGYAEKAAVRSGFLDEGMDMIGKPFTLDAFAAKVREMIKRR